MDGQTDGQTDVGHINLIGGLVTRNPPKNTENGYLHQSGGCHGTMVLSFHLKSQHHKFSHYIPSIHTNMLENPTQYHDLMKINE